ncbi:MAG: hypothetical protein HQK81_08320 [Desulfovibrionaceae bacterium]|nr:hypothetical protein [Desulfovibrionaceae bacterium]MBF0514055.1 hypothetical protein [Desulfovibrionaceae bacterium]
MSFDNFKLIFSYSRKQALDDGVLVDITQEAKESGFKIPVAVSDNLFHEYINPPPGLEGEGQSARGRLHDVLHMLKVAISSNKNEPMLFFDVLFLMRHGHHDKVELFAEIGPDGAGKPCMTICLPSDR